MPPTAAQLNELLELVWELSGLVDRSCAEIGAALARTNTMRAMGPNPSGVVTEAQVLAEIRILKHWIEQAKPSS